MAKAWHSTFSNLPRSSSISKTYSQKPSNVSCPVIESRSRDRSRKLPKDTEPRIKVPKWDPKYCQKIKTNIQKTPRPLTKISTWDGTLSDKLTVDYIFSLRQLSLTDISQDDDQDKEVVVHLSILKHYGSMISVEGSIMTSHTANCTTCLKPYCKEIDTNFSFCVVPPVKNYGLPVVGKIDHSAFFVEPGIEFDIDSMIRDSILVEASVKNTCSEKCEKSATIWEYIDDRVTFDQRWRKLLEIRHLSR